MKTLFTVTEEGEMTYSDEIPITSSNLSEAKLWLKQHLTFEQYMQIAVLLQKYDPDLLPI